MTREDSSGVLGGRAKKISASPGLNKLAATVWLIVSPAILARLLTGATPPDVFFHPVSFVLLVALYGGGALLVREASITWGTGWSGRILMAAAFALVLEGFVVKSYFGFGDIRLNPAFYLDNAAGIYFFHIATTLFFHAVFSILAPIAIAEALVSAEARRERWTGDAFFGAVLILFTLDACIGFLAYQDDRLASNWRLKTLGSLIAAAILVFAARKIVVPENKVRKIPGGAVQYFIEALVFSGAYIFVTKVLSRALVDSQFAASGAATAAALILCAGAGLRAWARFHKANAGAGHLAAAIWGVYLPWISIAPYLELDNANRIANTSGMTAVGIAVLILLWIWTIAALKSGPPKTANGGLVREQ